MKKQTARLLTAILLLSSFFGFSSCGKKLETGDVDALLTSALENTFQADIYYWKETITNGKTSSYRQVNVFALTDDDNLPVLDAQGGYTERKIQIVENVNQKKTLEIFCGLSEPKNGGEAQEMLLTERISDSGDSETTAVPMTAQTFYLSTEFEPYRPENLLKELTFLTAADMDFSIPDGAAKTNFYVTELSFQPTEEYLRRYEEQTGELSMFEGIKRVFIEIAYERIASVITYAEEEASDTNRVSEEERYKFQIVYLGPKFTIPQYEGSGAQAENDPQEKRNL